VALSIDLRTHRLALRDPFRIARSGPGDGTYVTTVTAELRDERFPDVVGLGEGFPQRYFGETDATMASVMPVLLEALGEPALTRDGLDEAASRMAHAIAGHGAARCAVDTALHDLAGKVVSEPVHRLRGLSADIPSTDFTLGLDEPDIVAARARRARAFPVLKIKCGGVHDLATLRAVRETYTGPIRVDANTGWTRPVAEALLPELEALGVELIEQPFPARAIDDLGWLQQKSRLPIIADESCVTVHDLDRLSGVVAGVNVKLAKAGGIGPAHVLLMEARRLGLRTFLGCMQETSVGIAASAAVASLAEWVDLDGCLMLADDPASGLVLGPDKRWVLTSRPGLGVDLDVRPGIG